MSKSKKLPAFQFYPGDWRKDPGVQALTFHHRGIWFEILLLMHESDERGKLLLNGSPYPQDALARTLGLSLDGDYGLSLALSAIITYGVASLDSETGAIICRRMVRDEENRKKLSDEGKKYGVLGGNPNFEKGKPNPYYKEKDNGKDKASDKGKISSSSSSSTSVIKNPPSEDIPVTVVLKQKRRTAYPITLDYENRRWDGIEHEKMEFWKNTFKAVNIESALQETLAYWIEHPNNKRKNWGATILSQLKWLQEHARPGNEAHGKFTPPDPMAETLALIAKRERS